jgi:glutathione S-transferase
MLVLVIGDKQLSSWSLRPWMLLRHVGLPFEEVSLPLDSERFRSEIRRHSPTGRVPVLVDGTRRVWDSLAICEYLAEISPGRAWPADRDRRALARSISAEMHAGFAALRSTWPMQAGSRGLAVELTPAAAADLARIDEIWSDCRESAASSGPWLFGDYSVADAMYAPVVLRCASYGARLSAAAAGYVEHCLADPPLQAWIDGARLELARAGTA